MRHVPLPRMLLSLLLTVVAALTLAPATARADDPPGWVVEEPAAADGPQARRLAVIVSGDGGWADLDRDLAELLQARGVAVVGIDALHYFWTRRTPDQAAADIAAVVDSAMTRWGRDEVILIGFSFGASVLPAIANRLPPDLKGKVVSAALLTSYTWANWEIHVGGWFRDEPDDHATDVLPEARALPMPLLCIYGTDETAKSVCPLLADVATVESRPGGHHFDKNYPALADSILRHADGGR